MKLSEKIKNTIEICQEHIQYGEGYSDSMREILSTKKEVLLEISPDVENLEKENEEMLNALIELLKRYDKNYLTTYFDNGNKYTLTDLYNKGDLSPEISKIINIIEKETGKKWSEII
jgi:hypothetical protein